MPAGKYGVLRGRVVATEEERSDPVSPHYQVQVKAKGEDWRIAINVQSTDRKGGPSKEMLLYRLIEDFRHPVTDVVKSLGEGFTRLDRRAGGGALDYVRGELFDPKDLRLEPANLPGENNDLNDLLDSHIQAAKGDADAQVFAFGLPWGPDQAGDKVFGFKPGRGIHDIHMNQGNPMDGGHGGDNGVWQDGGLLIWFPGANRWVAVFLAFQSQSWRTDDRTGRPI